MRKYLLALAIAVAFVFSITWAAGAAEDQTLAEKLLDVMRANHQITEAQYKELKKEAEKEKAAMATQASQTKAAEAQAAQAAAAAAAAQAAKAQVAQAPAAKAPGGPLDFNASWQDGLKFKTNDGNFTMHLGGRLQVDVGGDEVDSRLNKAFSTLRGYGAEVRRGRLEADGTLYSNIDWILEYDFASSGFTDANITYKGIPCLGNLKVGHMKEPFSLEELTSDNWLDFTERSLANAFVVTAVQYNNTGSAVNDYNTGVQLFDQEFGKRMTWAVGGFLQERDNFGFDFQKFNDFNVSARVTGLPWYENEGCQLLHVGFGYRHLFRTNDSANNPTSEDTLEQASLRFFNKPEFHLGSNTVNTSAVSAVGLAATGVDEIDPEVAFVYGPFSVQGEYFHVWVNDAVAVGDGANHPVGQEGFAPVGSSLGNAQFSGYYAYASYFLTGEHRNYNRDYGVFDRVYPIHNFDPHTLCGGAWEISARYSDINLNDNHLSGGQENDWTGSLIWWLNPNVRWMFDYVHAHVGNEFYGTPGAQHFLHNGDANIVDTRFQIVW